MSDDSHDELADLDDALFGDGGVKRTPAREPAPAFDGDLFAGIDDEPAVPLAPGDANLTAEPMPKRVSEPIAEGPILDAAIFGMSGESRPQPLRRGALHVRSPVDRRRRVTVLLLVIGLVALVSFGVAVVATDRSSQSAAKSQVKIVGTASPTSTAPTLAATGVAPPMAAPTTTPPDTTSPPSGHATTPARTNVPATDPGALATDPGPPATDSPPSPTDSLPPPTDPPTTTQPPPTTTQPPTTTT